MIRSRAATIALAATCVVAAPAGAQTASFEFVCDVPTDLSAATRLPWEVVAHDAAGGTYATAASLPGAPPVAALHRMQSGDLLIAVAVPTRLGAIDVDPRDLVRFDGSAWHAFLDGAAAGLPAGASIDAVFLDGGDAADPVVSFSAPTTVSGATYGPADLVRLASGGATLDLDAAAAGIPGGANVVGADRDGAALALAFDAPVDLGGALALPGRLVRRDGAAFTLLHEDPAWPAGSGLAGFSLLPAAVAGPGALPASLRLGRGPGGTVRLSWTASCGAAAADYGIYEGALGLWDSHAAVDCLDDGADRTEDVLPATGDRYFLVVPHDAAAFEGSYGLGAGETERAPGTATCQPARQAAQCAPGSTRGEER